MKKLLMVLIFLSALCVTIFAQNANNFRTDGKGTITGYDWWDTVIVIPDQIGNIPVTAIGDRVFRKMDITNITIPNNIKQIGDEAFADNKITSLTIGNVNSIGTRAFANNQLTNLTIGDNVTIEFSAFADNRLTSVSIGENAYVGGNCTIYRQWRESCYNS